MPEAPRTPQAERIVRRILQRHLEQARREARRGRTVTDRRIHATRKALKRARAALRLLRAGTEPAAYRRANGALRAAARPLGKGRDAKILLERLHETERHAGGPAPAPLRRALRSAHADALARADVDMQRCAAGLKSHLTALHALARPASRPVFEAAARRIIAAGLKRTYSRGRRALPAARAGRSFGPLHDARKQAQYLWHQLRMIALIAPRPARELARTAHRISDLLGEDHDLAVLAMRVGALRRRPASAAARAGRASDSARYARLVSAIDARRARLEDTAFGLARELYRAKPGAFARRVAGRLDG